MSFSQCRGLYCVENGHFPPEDIPFMPTRGIDWYKKVKDVPTETLYGYGNQFGEADAPAKEIYGELFQ